jgi:hypothetical protein
MIGIGGRFAIVSLLFAAACGGSSGGGASNASVMITAPLSGSVALGTDSAKSVPVSFTLSGFTLKAPGTCGGAANCGHLHLVIDSYTSSCNTAPGVGSEMYNVQVTTGTATSAQFATCGAPAGSHTITLEVHDDAHADVKDANGNLIKSAPVSITTH